MINRLEVGIEVKPNGHLPVKLSGVHCNFPKCINRMRCKLAVAVISSHPPTTSTAQFLPRLAINPDFQDILCLDYEYGTGESA